MINHSMLKETYEKLRRLPFPKCSHHEGVNDWISELAEQDGFYAGLAETLLAGGALPDIKDFPSLESQFIALENLKQTQAINVTQYQTYLNYLMVLDHLVKEIRKARDRA